MIPSRKSAQDNKSEKSGTRRPHRLFHSENETPILVQAALLPIELLKPTKPPSTPHLPPEERPRPSGLPGPSTLQGPSPFPGPPSVVPGSPSTVPGPPLTLPASTLPGPPSPLPTSALCGPPSSFQNQPSALPASTLPGPPSPLPTSALCGPPSSFQNQPSATSTLPGPPSPLPTSALCGPPSSFQNQPSALPTSTLPGPPSPLPSSAFCGQRSSFPSQPSALPTSTFSVPPQVFQGPPSSAPPATYFSPQPLPQPAKLASADNPSIPPPSTVQDPTPPSPYGGGQPPPRPSNPPVAYSTPQTPPYSNLPQPYHPHSQPTQQQPDDRQTPPSYMQPRNQSYSQPAQPMNQPVPQSMNQPIPQSMNQPIPQSMHQAIPQPSNQPMPPSSNQPIPQPSTQPQSQNQPVPQPRPRPQVPPQPMPPPQPAPQSALQARAQNLPSNPPRSPVSSNRTSEGGARNSSLPQPYSTARITAYPPARPVLPMPKPPPHLVQILREQEEQRKQQQYILLQQQVQGMQNLQNQVIEEAPQSYRDGSRQRTSTVDSRPCDLEIDSEVADTQPTETGRTSLKQRPRLNKRIVTVPPHHSSAQANPQPANSPPSTTGVNTNPNQRICTVPPHPYGTIIPRFSTQHAFTVTHNMATHPNQQGNRGPLAYSNQPPSRPDYLQSPLPGPTVNRPPNVPAGSYYQAPSKPETTTKNTVCQTDPTQEEGSSTPQGCPAKHDPVRDAPSSSPESEPLNPLAAPPAESQTPPNQSQGIQARLSHAQPLHSPAVHSTRVIGSAQMMPSSSVQYEGPPAKEDFYVPAYSIPPRRGSFSERSSGQSLLQQSFQMPQWEQMRQTPSPQYIQLGTFPPGMTFARPPGGGFVPNITERPLKYSLPTQVQFYPQNFSNVGVGIRSASSSPGDIRIGGFHPGLMHATQPGSPHHPRARSAGRISASESTASVWGSNSNPHHLP